MQTIKVTLEIEVSDTATKEDINDWVDVEYGECNSMKLDNPCRSEYNVMNAEWEEL